VILIDARAEMWPWMPTSRMMSRGAAAPGGGGEGDGCAAAADDAKRGFGSRGGGRTHAADVEQRRNREAEHH
jgi:hypothetical protein